MGVSGDFRGGEVANGTHAAVHQVAKSRRLQAPATNLDPGTSSPDPLLTHSFDVAPLKGA
jgi:hypothetical protein